MIRDALKHLPKTLDDTYSRMFLAIDEAYREDAKAALLWLAFAERPLQLKELAEATIIHPRSEQPFNPAERFPDPQNVLEILSSLVYVNDVEHGSASYKWDPSGILTIPSVPSGSATVTLAHYSVKEYLISNRIKENKAQYFAISEITSDIHIAESCLKYILYYASSTKTSNLRQDFNEFPLLKYAALNWYTHVYYVPYAEQKVLTPLILELLLYHSNLSSWLRVQGREKLSLQTFPNFEYGQPSIENALFCAAYLGLLQVVEELLHQGVDPNARDSYGDTPLHGVAKNGHEAVALMLLKHGAIVDATNRLKQTPFHWAAYCEHAPLVDLLLEWGADINAENKYGHTALHFAKTGSTHIMTHLLGKGASFEVRSNRDETLAD